MVVIAVLATVSVLFYIVLCHAVHVTFTPCSLSGSGAIHGALVQTTAWTACRAG